MYKIVMLIFLFAGIAFSQTPVNINETFEGNSFPPSGWLNLNFTRSNSKNHTIGGSYSARSDANKPASSNYLKSLSFRVVRGEKMQISLWYGTDNGNGNPCIVIKMIGEIINQSLDSFYIASGNDWTKRTFNLDSVLVSDDVRIAIFVNSERNAGAVYLDDISIIKTLIKPEAPKTPSNLVITENNINPPYLKLHWQDNSTNEDKFFIERKDNTMSPASNWILRDSVAANTVIYKDTAVTGGIVYTYRVYAKNATGVSGYTNEITNSALPVTIESFTYLVNRNDVTLNWVTISEINNSGFEIQNCFNGSSVWNNAGFISGSGTTTQPSKYTFSDRNLGSGKYKYRLKQVDYNGNCEIHELNEIVEIGVPVKFGLSQNYPNPFNPDTKINYTIPFDSKVILKVFDITGREVASLINTEQKAGYYETEFRGNNLSSGIYFYKLIAVNSYKIFTDSKKSVLIK